MLRKNSLIILHPYIVSVCGVERGGGRGLRTASHYHHQQRATAFDTIAEHVGCKRGSKHDLYMWRFHAIDWYRQSSIECDSNWCRIYILYGIKGVTCAQNRSKFSSISPPLCRACVHLISNNNTKKNRYKSGHFTRKNISDKSNGEMLCWNEFFFKRKKKNKRNETIYEMKTQGHVFSNILIH